MINVISYIIYNFFIFINISVGYNCENIGFFSGLTEEQCKNPFTESPNIPGVNSNGYYDTNKRCWVAVDDIDWQNLPCKYGTIQQYYIKVHLMYPDIYTNINKILSILNVLTKTQDFI